MTKRSERTTRSRTARPRGARDVANVAERRDAIDESPKVAVDDESAMRRSMRRAHGVSWTRKRLGIIFSAVLALSWRWKGW
ncbi:hypothetical protein N9D08_01405 [bacterium]|nr:hypothetical protein [bacterium]